MGRLDIKKKMEARKKAQEAMVSHKKRKMMEQIVRRKKMKTDRINLISELKQFQMKPEELKLMSSTASMQTLGLKKFTTASKPKQGKIAKIANIVQRAVEDLRREAANSDDTLRELIGRDDYARSHTLSESSGDTDDEILSEEDDNSSVTLKVVDSSTTEITEPGEKSEDLTDSNDLEDLSSRKSCPSQDTSKNTESNNEIQLNEKIELITGEQPPAKRLKKSKKTKAVYVPVFRTPEVEKYRAELPIIGEESQIIDMIRENDIIVVSGETGSGKTTQIPQFLYEAGYALNDKLIGITEPRRVAAISMSQRVGQELNLFDGQVSYQIRFEGDVSSKTQIKFMTDGVLMKECQNDFLLSKYSVVIIDEAHECSVFSDILIGLLSRIVPLRKKKGDPLKLIIMSATLRVQDFTENRRLFPISPPIFNINARQFKVAVQFKKTTPTDYLTEAFKKVCSIHNRLPRGGILVFVATRKDVLVLCKKLRHRFSSSLVKKDSNDFANLTDYGNSKLHCLELYAMLPVEKQKLVFSDPPKDSRLCVVSTNVAETSITIPNIRYVVDTGKEKTKLYDCTTGVSKFVTTWTSKASAEQRKGRAGRTCTGYCFRLYSSAVYLSDFPEFSEPEIIRKPTDDLVLLMKTMNIDNVVNFPFPTSPQREALKASEARLILLGALCELKNKNDENEGKNTWCSRPTDLGHAMARFAVGTRYAKMIATSPVDILPYVIAIVSALSVRELFVRDTLDAVERNKKGVKKANQAKKWQEIRQKWSGLGQSRLLGDFMVLLKAVGAAHFAKYSSLFCEEHGLRMPALLEIHKLRCQLTTEINQINSDANLSVDSQALTPPSESQIRVLRQLILSAFPDHVAKRIPQLVIPQQESVDDGTKKERKIIKDAYECYELEHPVFISSESVLRHDASKNDLPDYVVYKEIYESGTKMYMRDLAVIDQKWLPEYASKMCTFSEPIESTDNELLKPKYNPNRDQVMCYRSSTFGPMSWPIPPVELPMNDCGLTPYRLFAQALLEGRVYNWFKRYVTKLLSPPTIMTRSWSRLQPRTEKIVQALVAHNVKSKQDLVKIWSTNNKYLLREYLLWLPECTHSSVCKEWNNLLSNIIGSSKD